MKTMASSLWIGLLLAGAAAGLLGDGRQGEPSHLLTAISPRKMADTLHAVIASYREVYARELVQGLALEEGIVAVSEDWRRERCLPVHAQLLRMASQNIQRHGAEFSFVLRSLWPMDPANGPQTRIEQAGLEFVARHPETNYYSEEMLGGRRYFTAVYPDRAIFASCVECHNRHPSSPRRDFALDDVMGGIVVRVPLEF
jgi:hypothetical protein